MDTDPKVDLEEDTRLWIVGGRPWVQMVIVIRWAKVGVSGERVRGDVEFWDRDDEVRGPRLMYKEVGACFF